MGPGLTLRSLQISTWQPIVPNPAGLSFVVGDSARCSLIVLVVRACLDPGTTWSLAALMDNGVPPPTPASLGVSSPLGMNATITLDNSLSMECGATARTFALKGELLAELGDNLGVPGLYCPLISGMEPLQLTDDVMTLFAAMSQTQKWRLLQDWESRRAAFMQRREDLEARVEATREELVQLEESRNAASTGDGLERLRERARVTEAELKEATESLQRIEATWKRWQEHQTLTQALARWRQDLDNRTRDVARLTQLELDLGGRFPGAPTAEALRMDLHLLEVNRNDLRRQTEQKAENLDKLARARQDLERAQADVSGAYPEYQGLSPEFPVYLHLYKTCLSYHQAAQDEASALTDQLQTNTTAVKTYPQFNRVPSDFQVQVGALAANEKEVAQQLPPLQEKLKERKELEEKRERLSAEICHTFDEFPDDWPARLRKLQALRQQVDSIREAAGDVGDRRELLEEARPAFLSLTDEWPADFPDLLRQVRQSRAAWLQEDAREADMWQLQSLEADISRQLKSYDGLDEQPDLPERLQRLLKAREELFVETEASKEMHTRIAELKGQVAKGPASFGEWGDQYPTQVEWVRGRLAELHALEERIEVGKKAQWERRAVEARMAPYHDLEQAAETFPDQLREYFRLVDVLADLNERLAVMDEKIRTLHGALKKEYPMVETVTITSVLDGLRTEDDTLSHLLRHIDRERDGRTEKEARLAVVRAELDQMADIVKSPEKQAYQIEAIELAALVRWMRTTEELEALRNSVLQIVSSRLERFGIELVVEDYLSYQATRAEIDRLEADKERLLRRSGTGNDQTRIQDKLRQLADTLGADVIAQPMEASLERFAALSALREELNTLKSSGPDVEVLERECQDLQGGVRMELSRLHIADENDLPPALTRFQEHQAAVLSLAALEEAAKARWPQLVHPDGGVVGELDRRKDELTSLEASLGAWGRTVKSTADIPPLVARWTEAQQLHAERASLLADLATLPAADEVQVAEVTLPHVDVEDDLLMWMWEQRAQFNLGLEQLEAEQSRVLAQTDESGQALLDRLQREIEALEKEIPDASADDAQIEKFEKDFEVRAELAATEDRITLLGTVEDLTAACEAVSGPIREQRAALEIAADASLETVLKDYATFGELSEQRRLLVRLLGAQDRTMADLQEKLNELRPRLNGRETKELDGELARYQLYAAEVERIKGLEQEPVRLEEEVRLASAGLADVEQLVNDVEGRLGEWTRGLETPLIQAACDNYIQTRGEVQSLQERLKDIADEAVLRERVQEAEKQIFALGDVVEPPPGLLEQMEQTRRDQLETTRRLQELQAGLSRPEVADNEGASSDMDPAEVSRLIDVQRDTLSKLEGEMKAVDAALQKVSSRMEESPLERCRERASELLSRLTRGRYIQISLDGAKERWLWPARGGKVRLEESGTVKATAGLCWLLAVLNELGCDYPWPIVLDQPFDQVQTTCRFQVLEALNDLARDRQVVVLTAANSVVSQHLVVANLDEIGSRA